MEQNYLSYSVLEMGRNRFVVNVEGMLWTYAITQNPDLLAMAEEAWAQEGAELTQTNCLDDSELHMHGVTMNELMKIPMLLYAYTGKSEYLQAALKADEKMEQANMLADGVNSSSEALAGNGAMLNLLALRRSARSGNRGRPIRSSFRCASRLTKAPTAG